MVCLETSFIIDFFRGEEKARSLYQRFKSENETLSVTTPTIMELISGASLEKTGKEKEETIEFLSSLIILSLDKESSILAGEIEGSLIMAGETVPAVDIMIGAIAKHNKETLITRNKKHFEKIKGLEIESY